VFLQEIDSNTTIVLVATFRKLVNDYMKQECLLSGAASKLLELYRVKEDRRKHITSAMLCVHPPYQARPLHYNPMVHASVLVHWVTRIPNNSLLSLHQEKIIEVAIMMTAPIRYKQDL
jgi:hypothetical protein